MSRRVLVAVFDAPGGVLQATKEARERGYEIVDVYTPFAVHGLEEAMGLPPSRLTWVCFAGGLTGLSLGMAFQLWASMVDWPLNVGGKPLWSIPAFVPVAFELTILLAGLSVTAAMLWRARLRPWGEETLVDPRVTDDRFAIVVRQTDASFSPRRARALFESHGALAVEEREEATP